MFLFFILAPFGVFALLMLVTTTAISLLVAAAISIGFVAHDMIRGGSLKLFAAGTAIIFSTLAAYVIIIDGNWSGVVVRLAVDGGILAIALLSIAIRVPFTLQYARENVDAETLKMPGFIKANYVLTWAWTGALVLMLIADMLAVYAPSVPLWVGFAIAFAARNSAAYFTKWYPQHRRAKRAQQMAAESLISSS